MTLDSKKRVIQPTKQASYVRVVPGELLNEDSAGATARSFLFRRTALLTGPPAINDGTLRNKMCQFLLTHQCIRDEERYYRNKDGERHKQDACQGRL